MGQSNLILTLFRVVPAKDIARSSNPQLRGYAANKDKDVEGATHVPMGRGDQGKEGAAHSLGVP